MIEHSEKSILLCYFPCKNYATDRTFRQCSNLHETIGKSQWILFKKAHIIYKVEIPILAIRLALIWSLDEKEKIVTMVIRGRQKIHDNEVQETSKLTTWSTWT